MQRKFEQKKVKCYLLTFVFGVNAVTLSDCEDMGSTRSWSSITKHVWHDDSDKINLKQGTFE